MSAPTPEPAPMQGPTATYCPDGAGYGQGPEHAYSTHMGTPVSVQRCYLCGYINWADLAEQVTALTAELARERDAARAEADRLRPVVVAARAAVNTDGCDEWNELVDVVVAYEANASVEPEQVGGRWLATWSITGPVERVVEQARIALAQMAGEYADAGPVKLRAELRADGGDPR